MALQRTHCDVILRIVLLSTLTNCGLAEFNKLCTLTERSVSSQGICGEQLAAVLQNVCYDRGGYNKRSITGACVSLWRADLLAPCLDSVNMAATYVHHVGMTPDKQVNIEAIRAAHIRAHTVRVVPEFFLSGYPILSIQGWGFSV